MFQKVVLKMERDEFEEKKIHQEKNGCLKKKEENRNIRII